MTRRTNARIAGITFLLYIVTGISSMALSSRALAGVEGPLTILATLSQHATLLRLNVVLILLQAVYAFVLAVTIWALTRDQDPDLAMLALVFRAGEGVINAVSVARTLALLSMATALPATAARVAPATPAVADLLLKVSPGAAAAFCFAAGSTIYSILFLRARSIPIVLAWLGVLASTPLVVLVPAQLAGVVRGPVTGFMWIPMLVFEVALAVWLIVRGAAAPARVASVSA